MNYWLMKTDPDTYSWEDLVKDKKTEWTGVRNYEARNNMKKMEVGDLILMYESGEDRCIVGTAKVITKAHRDSTDTTGMWWCVDIAAVKPVKKITTLDEVKKIPACKDMALLKKSRLSVQPVTEQEWFLLVD